MTAPNSNSVEYNHTNTFTHFHLEGFQIKMPVAYGSCKTASVRHTQATVSQTTQGLVRKPKLQTSQRLNFYSESVLPTLKIICLYRLDLDSHGKKKIKKTPHFN